MNVKRTPEKEVAFLAALSVTGSVAHACTAAGIGRSAVYQWRREDPDFALRWEEARAIGMEALEDEAIRRAHDGVEEPVFYQGEATGTIRRYSDTLLIFLLKGAKPDVYRDRVSNEISGPGGKPIEMDAQTAGSKLEAILGSIAARIGPKDDASDLA